MTHLKRVEIHDERKELTELVEMRLITDLLQKRFLQWRFGRKVAILFQKKKKKKICSLQRKFQIADLQVHTMYKYVCLA